MSMTHTCRACGQARQPGRYLCYRCWMALPAPARRALSLRGPAAASLARLRELHAQLDRGVPLADIRIDVAARGVGPMTDHPLRVRLYGGRNTHAARQLARNCGTEMGLRTACDYIVGPGDHSLPDHATVTCRGCARATTPDAPPQPPRSTQ